uniref:Uncharacterized protein n=1 Tax=Cannabis sativa TaxID=3483 RepID=A0A803NR42_CANSA
MLLTEQIQNSIPICLYKWEKGRWSLFVLWLEKTPCDGHGPIVIQRTETRSGPMGLSTLSSPIAYARGLLHAIHGHCDNGGSWSRQPQ